MEYTYCQKYELFIYGCTSLKYLPLISKWDTHNLIYINNSFFGCTSLISLPDISKWDMENVKDISYMFYSCSSLVFLPNISKWKVKDTIKIKDMFKGCNSLLSIPDVSKWNINISKELNIFSFNSDLLSIKSIKSDSVISDNMMKNFILPKDSFSFKNNNDSKSFENEIITITDDSKNEELYDYYENFYN